MSFVITLTSLKKGMPTISTGHYLVLPGTDSQVEKKYSNEPSWFIHIVPMQMHKRDFS